MKFFILARFVGLLGVVLSTKESSSTRDAKAFFFPFNALGSIRNGRCNCDRQFQQLQKQLSVLKAQTNALQASIANNAPRCPNTSANARRIQDKCYSINVGPATYDLAIQDCASQGGILAEPTLTADGLTAFTDSLNAAFPGILTGLQDPYINLAENIPGQANNFQYSTGQRIEEPRSNLITGVPAKGVFEVATLDLPTGNSLVRQNRIGTTSSYICQMNLV